MCVVSDPYCPSMYPYPRSLFYLISFSLCSYEFSCLAKEKTIRSFHNTLESGYNYPSSTPLGINDITNSPLVKHGLLHDEHSDIDISGRKYFYINKQYFKAKGGAVTAKTLNISKNTGPIIFRENSSNNNGGAIASTNCNITDNKARCCFIKNLTIVDILSSSPSLSGGAISCSQLVISNNQDPCEFLNNTCTIKGGAIASNNVHITNNYGAVILNSNKCIGEKSSGGGNLWRELLYHLESCSHNLSQQSSWSWRWYLFNRNL